VTRGAAIARKAVREEAAEQIVIRVVAFDQRRCVDVGLNF